MENDPNMALSINKSDAPKPIQARIERKFTKKNVEERICGMREANA